MKKQFIADLWCQLLTYLISNCNLLCCVFKVVLEQPICWEIFHGKIYLLSELLLEICWKKVTEKLFHVFVLKPHQGFELGVYI